MNSTITPPGLERITSVELGDPIDMLKAWQNTAWQKFDNSPIYTEIHSFYEGYASACGDALNLLKAKNKETVVEDIVKTHKIRRVLLVATVVGTTVYIVKKRNKKQS